MELKSCTYATVTTLGDFGPWISKVVLDLPCTVRANDIDARTFHIYVERLSLIHISEPTRRS